MSAISTVATGSVGRAGLMSMTAYADSGAYMEVLFHYDLSLVLELTVGGELGPWYIARNLHMASASQDMVLRILTAQKHFLRRAGGLSTKLSSPMLMWDIFKEIWDYLETDALLA